MYPTNLFMHSYNLTDSFDIMHWLTIRTWLVTIRSEKKVAFVRAGNFH